MENGASFNASCYEELKRLWSGNIIHNEDNITVRKIEISRKYLLRIARDLEQETGYMPWFGKIFQKIVERLRNTKKEYKYAVFIGDRLAGQITVTIYADDTVELTPEGEIGYFITPHTQNGLPQESEIVRRLMEAAKLVANNTYPARLDRCKTLEEYRKMLLEDNEEE